jgi:3-hydroxybutyryl-CoA dehydratase
MNFVPRTLHQLAPPVGSNGDAASMLALRMLHFEDLSIGQTEFFSKTVSSSGVVGFAEVIGDRNPIHLSEHFAAQSTFGMRIARGVYTASLISALLGTRLPGPGAMYISQALNFRAPVKTSDKVVVTVMVAEFLSERSRARLTCAGGQLTSSWTAKHW